MGYRGSTMPWLIGFIKNQGKPKQVLLPAIIRAFIDLSGVSTGVSIRIAVGSQNVRGGKLYALKNSFTVVLDANTACPNTMIGRLLFKTRNCSNV